MKKNTSAKLGHWLDCLFGSYSDKIKIIANVLVHDWRMRLPEFSLSSSLEPIGEEEFETAFPELDAESHKNIKRFLLFQKVFSAARQYQEYFLFNYGKLFTEEESRKRRNLDIRYQELCRKLPFPYVGPESVIFHHGLPFFPEAAIQYLYGGNFIDAGACYGDSALIFSRFYKPARIHAFEPSKENREIMQRMMTRLHIPLESYEIIPFGLGKNREHVFFCDREGQSSFGIQENKAGIAVDILPLDDYVQERKLTDIRLIKADLEGMGLAMLQGSRRTIRENRPLLTLSIYHNRKELFEIYRTLRSWDLNYAFTVRSTAFPLGFSEINLLGYPMELNHGPDMWNTDEAAFQKIFELSKLLLQNERYRNRK